jgi:hypothetical protein
MFKNYSTGFRVEPEGVDALKSRVKGSRKKVQYFRRAQKRERERY